MTACLDAKHIKIFDYIKFIMALREKIRANAEAPAKAHGSDCAICASRPGRCFNCNFTSTGIHSWPQAANVEKLLLHGWAMPFSILPILTAPKGFNLPAEEDANLLRLLLRGEFTISGFSARNLRPLLADKSPGQISRIIKKLKELFAIPQLANTVA